MDGYIFLNDKERFSSVAGATIVTNDGLKAYDLCKLLAEVPQDKWDGARAPVKTSMTEALDFDESLDLEED